MKFELNLDIGLVPFNHFGAHCLNLLEKDQNYDDWKVIKSNRSLYSSDGIM